MESKAETGRRYRVRLLRTLAKLGYASTRQVAMAVIGECTLSARKMASRTIRWLLERGYIVEKRDDINSERMVAVTAAGANYLAENGDPLPGGKAHARDWLRHAHSHRNACNSTYVSEVRGLDIDIGWSELEIKSGAAPAHLAAFEYSVDREPRIKIPDVLFNFSGDDGDNFVWVEVENCWRGADDFRKLIGFLRAIFSQPAPPISKVWFVISTPGAKSIGARLVERLGRPDKLWDAHRDLDARILANHIKIFSLNHDTLELEPRPLG